MTNTNDTVNIAKPFARTTSALGKLGVVLILLSGVCFFSMLSVPWWPLESGSKVIVAGGLFVCVQITWWLGAALLGPTALRALRQRLRLRRTGQ